MPSEMYSEKVAKTFVISLATRLCVTTCIVSSLHYGIDLAGNKSAIAVEYESQKLFANVLTWPMHLCFFTEENENIFAFTLNYGYIMCIHLYDISAKKAKI